MRTSDHPATVRRGDDVSNRDGKHRRNGGGTSKIDWGIAFTYFAGDPTLGAREVAEKFAVSTTAVRTHMRKERWAERRRELLAEATERNRPRIVRSLEARQADTIAIGERLRAIALAEDAEIDLELAVKMLPIYSKLEQLFAGEATERVDVRARALIVSFMPRFAALSPPERHGERDALLDEFEGELAALEAGGEPA